MLLGYKERPSLKIRYDFKINRLRSPLIRDPATIPLVYLCRMNNGDGESRRFGRQYEQFSKHMLEKFRCVFGTPNTSSKWSIADGMANFSRIATVRRPSRVTYRVVSN